MIYDGDRLVKSVKRKILTPGEMEKIKLSADEIRSVENELKIGIEV